MRPLRSVTRLQRDFRSALAITVSGFAQRTGFLSTCSTKLPTTRVRTPCAFFRVSFHTFRGYLYPYLELRWTVRSMTQIRLRKGLKKSKMCKFKNTTGYHVSRTISVRELVAAPANYRQDNVRIMNKNVRPSLTRAKHAAIMHVSTHLVSLFSQSEAVSTVLHRIYCTQHAGHLTSRLSLDSNYCLQNFPPM